MNGGRQKDKKSDDTDRPEFYRDTLGIGEISRHLGNVLRVWRLCPSEVLTRGRGMRGTKPPRPQKLKTFGCIGS